MNGCKHEHADRQCHHPDLVKEEGYIDWCGEGPGYQRQDPDIGRIEEIKARCEAAIKTSRALYTEPANIFDIKEIIESLNDIPFLLREIDRLKMMLDAAAAGQETMQKQWAADVADRDAAVADLEMVEHCETCRYRMECELDTCGNGYYEWRGVQK